MKNLLILFTLFFTINLKAQYLIVTSAGDTINCKITKDEKQHLYYTYIKENQVTKTLIAKPQCKDYKYTYFSKSELPQSQLNIYKTSQKWRVAVNGGYSYRTAKIVSGVSTEMEDYMRGLKSGYHLGGDIDYFVTEQIGLGLKYSFFNTSNSGSNIDISGYGDIVAGMSDNIYINYIGPRLSTRILNANKTNALIMSASLGCLSYRNNAVLMDKYIFRGSTLGVTCDIGYDIGLSEHMALGFNLSFLLGKLTKVNIDNGVYTETIKMEGDNEESLARIDLSVGLRFGW